MSSTTKVSTPATGSGPRYGRGVLSLVGVVTTVGCWIADFNESHVYNPQWMPHAKFHNGQTMSMGTVLGLSTLYYVWREDPAVTALTVNGSGAKGKDAQTVAQIRRSRLHMAVWLASMYWITQLSAWFFPGALALDPPGDPKSFPQFYISSTLLTLTGLGYWLEARRL